MCCLVVAAASRMGEENNDDSTVHFARAWEAGVSGLYTTDTLAFLLSFKSSCKVHVFVKGIFHFEIICLCMERERN